MRDEDDVEEAEIIFTNKTDRRYSLKPLYTNASAHTFLSVGKRQNYAHLSLVENVDFILKGRHGDQAIKASTVSGIKKGWDLGTPD
jgi:hypothetical protein